MIPITEKIVKLERTLFDKPDKINSHTRYCQCIGCRQFYEEDLINCEIEGCILPPLPDCIRNLCFKHHKRECVKDGL